MSEIRTRLIGTGIYSNGMIVLVPSAPWVIWDGDSNRAAPKRLFISSGVLLEFDRITPAVAVPTYIPAGSAPPDPIITPEDCFYRVQIIQNGRTVQKGFWRVPYDPSDNGAIWTDLFAAVINNSPPIARFEATPEFKVYANSGVMSADWENVLEGTIAFATSEGTYWGRTGTKWLQWTF